MRFFKNIYDLSDAMKSKNRVTFLVLIGSNQHECFKSHYFYVFAFNVSRHLIKFVCEVLHYFLVQSNINYFLTVKKILGFKSLKRIAGIKLYCFSRMKVVYPQNFAIRRFFKYNSMIFKKCIAICYTCPTISCAQTPFYFLTNQDNVLFRANKASNFSGN